MNLTADRRVRSSRGAGFTITERLFSTDRFDFFRGGKTFLNYREQDRSLYEAGPDETLGVLIRAPSATNPNAVELRGLTPPGIDFELERVFRVPHAYWLPEPIDLIESEEPGEDPALVLSFNHGQPLTRMPSDGIARGVSATVCLQLLDLIEAHQGQGWTTGPISGDEVLVAPCGRWNYLGTFRTRPVASSREFAAELAAWSRLAGQVVDRLVPQEHRGETVERAHKGRAVDQGEAALAELIVLGEKVGREAPASLAALRGSGSWAARPVVAIRSLIRRAIES